MKEGIRESLCESKVDSNLLCFKCKNILWMPLDCPNCQKMFCTPCITSPENSPTKTICCPNCGRSEIFKSAHPVIMEHIIKKLQFRCPCAEECSIILSYNEFDKHKCPFESVECPWKGCPERVQRIYISEHQKVCEYRQMDCKYLGCCDKYIKKNMNEHLEKCKYRPTSCPNCFKSMLFHELKEEHLEICPRTEISCPKCDSIFIRELLPTHNCLKHLQSKISSLEAKNSTLAKESRMLKEENEELRDKSDELFVIANTLRMNNLELEEKLDKLRKSLIEDPLIACKLCENYYFGGNLFKCGVCQSYLCDPCHLQFTEMCQECGSDVCRKCIFSCDICCIGSACRSCSTQHFRLQECPICGKYMCQGCSGVCQICVNSICANCRFQAVCNNCIVAEEEKLFDFGYLPGQTDIELSIFIISLYYPIDDKQITNKHIQKIDELLESNGEIDTLKLSNIYFIYIYIYIANVKFVNKEQEMGSLEAAIGRSNITHLDLSMYLKALIINYRSQFDRL